MTQLPGAPHLARRSGQLHLEGVALADVAQQWGTPTYAYSKASILAALGAYQAAFSGRNAHIHYAVKANSSLAILALLHKAGCGFDIVSQGELQRVLHVGAPASSVVFAGVGKTASELAFALEQGVGCFNVESPAELSLLADVAQAHGKVARIGVRVNPNVDAKTHPYISTGLKANKFGVAQEAALAVYRDGAAHSHIEVHAIDCHIGSQITQEAPYLEAMDKVLDLVERIEAAGIALAHIDFGGGLGIQYRDEVIPDAQALWKQLLAKIDARGHGGKSIGIEPGRSLVGNAGVCLTQVLYTKQGEAKNFCIVDAAMNDMPRPAMYQAYHAVEPLQEALPGHAAQTYDVVGPVCESGDWLARDRLLAVAQGDVLAMLSAGAYCASMASNYNTRTRGAEVLVDGSTVTLIRERERFEDLIARERL